MKMYIHWAGKQEFDVEVLSVSEGGTEGGIREATMTVKGPWAYGYLRAEGGIHRLVRKSPFDQITGGTQVSLPYFRCRISKMK